MAIVTGHRVCQRPQRTCAAGVTEGSGLSHSRPHEVVHGGANLQVTLTLGTEGQGLVRRSMRASKLVDKSVTDTAPMQSGRSRSQADDLVTHSA